MRGNDNGAKEMRTMQVSERMRQIQTMLQREPDDPFLIYGLAMEFKKASALNEALAAFDRVIAVDPAYCYAYFQKGQTLELKGDSEAARKAYQAGIAAASGDAHAREELEGALNMTWEGTKARGT
jgi:tetratricopeptide (TPR) repeat protein